MFIPSPTEGGSYENAPAGTHVTSCYRVIDLGTQQTNYQGKVKESRKILISWELANENMSDGRPFTIGKSYAFSMHEKANLRKDLESWRGRPFSDKDMSGPPDGFDLKKILGVPCILTIAHKEVSGSTFANIASIGGMVRGMPKPPPPLNPVMIFSLDPKEFDWSVFNMLSARLQETIRKSPEYAHVAGTPAVQPAYDVAGRPVAAAPPIQPAQQSAPLPVQHPKQQIARPSMSQMADAMNDEIPF